MNLSDKKEKNEKSITSETSLNLSDIYEALD